MSTTGRIAGAVGSFTRDFMAGMRPPTPFKARLAEHFGTTLNELPVIERAYGAADTPNLQLAVEDWLKGPGRSLRVGVDHLDEAFTDLVLQGGALTRSLSGFAASDPSRGAGA